MEYVVFSVISLSITFLTSLSLASTMSQKDSLVFSSTSTKGAVFQDGRIKASCLSHTWQAASLRLLPSFFSVPYNKDYPQDLEKDILDIGLWAVAPVTLSTYEGDNGVTFIPFVFIGN